MLRQLLAVLDYEYLTARYPMKNFLDWEGGRNLEQGRAKLQRLLVEANIFN
jgi:hypothetical protein